MSRPPERILVVKLADLGDALTATPALRALKETFPRARIDVLTSHAGAAVLGSLPGVTGVTAADRHLLDSPRGWFRPDTCRQLSTLARSLRGRGYDHLILMHHLSTPLGALKWRALTGLSGARTIGLDNGRGGFLDVGVEDRGFGVLHEVQYGLRLVAALGAHTGDESLAVSIPDEARVRAESLLASLQGRPYAVVHPGSGGYSLARRWAPERFAAVADGLVRDLGMPVVLVGGPADGVDRVRALMSEAALDLSCRTEVLTLAAVLAGASLFVGGDSGVMHLATAAGAPVLALFGPTDPRAWGPWRPSGPGLAPVSVIQGTCPHGGPCLYTGHSVGRRHGCPTRECLQSIEVQDVLRRARVLLDR